VKSLAGRGSAQDYGAQAAHADRTAFSGRTGTRVVEPGEIRVAVGGASDQLPLQGSFTLRGPERAVGADRVLDTQVLISDD
jgi:beta-xylosidase